MEALRTIGAVLRWILRTAVTVVVAALIVRAIVEFIPRIGGLPPVRPLMIWGDPVLENLARIVQLPWTHEMRLWILPGLAVGIILLRTAISDGFDRLMRSRLRRPAPAAANRDAAPAQPAQASASAPPGPSRTGETTILQPQAPQSVNTTNFGGLAMPAAAEGPPQRIGRYDIIGKLGHGAMGIVYKATDPRIGRTVAIKTISTAGTGVDMDQYRERFVIEAKSAGRLNHPGVVSVYDVTDDDAGRPCLVLEFVEGTTLDRVMSKDLVPLPRALDIVAQVARALDYAHTNGIVHRDVKPANIMLTASGQAKLSDFGIAKMEGTTMTIAGQILGTPAFMSPEQCTGSALDRRSDIFSLGTVLYMLATGTKPFSGDTFTAVAYQVVHTAPLPASQVKPALPVEIDRIIAKCLAKNVAERYGTAGELANDIDALRAANPAAA
jgi:hypothetical protein